MLSSLRRACLVLSPGVMCQPRCETWIHSTQLLTTYSTLLYVLLVNKMMKQRCSRQAAFALRCR